MTGTAIDATAFYVPVVAIVLRVKGVIVQDESTFGLKGESMKKIIWLTMADEWNCARGCGPLCFGCGNCPVCEWCTCPL